MTNREKRALRLIKKAEQIGAEKIADEVLNYLEYRLRKFSRASKKQAEDVEFAGLGRAVARRDKGGGGLQSKSA
jgi:hypothetical protein